MKNSAWSRKKPNFSDNQHLKGLEMFPEGGTGVCFEGINLEGRNSGASMIARNSRGLQDSCSINIYISNNVQGVNNSILTGSEVKQGDPGVRLVLKGLKLDKGFQKTREKKTAELVGAFGWVALLAAVVMFLFSLM